MGTVLSVMGGEAAKTSASKKSTQSEKGTKRSEAAAKTEKEPTKKRKYVVAVDHQCGLENDGTEWYEGLPPLRITSSQATPEQATKYQSIIDAILHPDIIFGKRVNFDPNDVRDVMIEVQPYLASEGALIEDVPFGVNVVGDIHGQLYDLARAFKIHAKDGKPGHLNSKYLFLGNYVGRSHQSLEVIMLLFCLKMLYPDNFFLLRGNHEFADINVSDGFGRECAERYADPTFSEIFAQVNEAFGYLSLGAIVGDRYCCVHGGVPSRMFTRVEMRNIPKPIHDCRKDILVMDMMWSDPADGLKGTAFNYARGRSSYFGLDVLVYSLTSVGCTALFRGHSMITAGFENMWGACFTVYTCTSEANNGAIAYIDENGHVHRHILVTSDKRNDLMMELDGGDEKPGVDNGGGDGQSMIMGQE